MKTCAWGQMPIALKIYIYEYNLTQNNTKYENTSVLTAPFSDYLPVRQLDPKTNRARNNFVPGARGKMFSWKQWSTYTNRILKGGGDSPNLP